MKKNIIGKYFFYLFSILACWVLVGQLIQSKLKIEDYELVNGTIDTAYEVVKKNKGRSGGKSYELRIYLKDRTEYFRLMKIYKYDSFRAEIKKGENTDIYIRPKWLVPLGMGYKNDIFQMSIGGKSIFTLSETKQNSNGIILAMLLCIPGFIFLGRWIGRNGN